MAKFVYKITSPSVANYQSQKIWNKMLLHIETIWPPSKMTWMSKKRYIISKTSTTFPPPHKTLGVCVETNIPKNSKAIILLALCPGRCLLHHKSIENNPTIFGNLKFAVIQWPNSHTFNFLYEMRLYRGNAILEMLYSRLKKIIGDSRMMVDEAASNFELSWTFV